MNLNLTGNHVEITPAMRDYVNSKIDKIARHFDHVIEVNVILSVEKHKQKAEANVHIRGKDIFVEAEGVDMYASIDSLVDKLDRQLLKYKEKNIERRNHDALKNQEFDHPE
ncbi:MULTISPECIES: ribosome hibernation-promoting factor, HPF/YfiA family [unclassified Nitrosomonas]|jgi:putative sigma-54 modulation protein|uniref:ribosome hibernation-promoting factor, HPF/YfiA family n=1 Tax=unclassified Nitrosomonas TaxID=2609265 RepID=UPI0008856D03|nr:MULTISPECIES: ribosome-associated translation inhibitor RaiA [unclassified Nitrosomonas]SDG91934.1 putative sigma-54 modulation protein [Nitrosomonas sp. Nm132]SDY06825.1 putative sigma-54 modulation protein [Nitrosomonas sp. Nm58]